MVGHDGMSDTTPYRALGEPFLAALEALAGEGALVVIATHDLALAARQDAVLLLTDPPRTGPAGQILTPAALAALYGAPLAVCPSCGRPHG